jgi:hypothetical protein
MAFISSNFATAKRRRREPADVAVRDVQGRDQLRHVLQVARLAERHHSIGKTAVFRRGRCMRWRSYGPFGRGQAIVFGVDEPAIAQHGVDGIGCRFADKGLADKIVDLI